MLNEPEPKLWRNFLGKLNKKRESKRIHKALKYFIYAFIFLLFIAAIRFIGAPFVLKGAYNSAFLGRENLENALVQIKKENYTKASILASSAQSNFGIAKKDIEKIKKDFIFSRINFIGSQLDDIEHLIFSLERLSSAAERGSLLQNELEELLESGNKMSFSKFNKEEKKKILGFISASSSSFENIKNDFEASVDNLDKLQYRGALRFVKVQIEDFKSKIKEGEDILSKAIPILKIFPYLAGYPEKKHYLIALQNSDELRPTGGFIGTFSIMSLEGGEILNCDTSDVYHLDMPVREILNIAPPEPLKRYLAAERWFMRDANWSPDWPQSAKKIEWFYKQENSLLPKEDAKFGGDFDGIIAVNPMIITDFLDIAGPIEIEGTEYNKDNFVDLLQYRVEKGYVQLGIPSWSRKEVISEIYRKLKIKLFDLPFSSWKNIIEIFDKNLKEKNILIYLHNSKMQKIVLDEGFTGEIKDVKSDYIMAVDANMAAFKTDAVMRKNISYKMVQEDPASLIAKLNISYKHEGGFDWKTTRYRSYTRVYVPKGSTLIKAEGILGDVEVYDEFDKTCFAGFISIEPGRSGFISYEYKLPEHIAELIKKGEYELYFQKQPGNKLKKISVDLNFIKTIKSFSPVDFCLESEKENSIKFESDFSVDRVYRIKF